jgi:hypothetical protein
VAIVEVSTMENEMKTLLIGFSAASLASLAFANPSYAREYKYCLYEGMVQTAGDCSFATYQQCAASASGRVADCKINPRYAFGRKQRIDR